MGRRLAIFLVFLGLIFPKPSFSQGAPTTLLPLPEMLGRPIAGPGYCNTETSMEYPDESRELCPGNCGGQQTTPLVTIPPVYTKADGTVSLEMRADAGFLFNRPVQGIACGQARSDSINLEEISPYDLSKIVDETEWCATGEKRHEKFHDWNADLGVAPANFIPFAQEMAEHWAGRLDAEHYTEAELQEIWDQAKGKVMVESGTAQNEKNQDYSENSRIVADARRKIFLESGVLGKLLPQQIQYNLKANFITYIKTREQKGYFSLYDAFKIDGVRLMDMDWPPVAPSYPTSNTVTRIDFSEYLQQTSEYQRKLGVWVEKYRPILDKMALFPNESARGQIKLIVCDDREYQNIQPSYYEVMKMGLAADMIFRTLQPKVVSQAFYSRIPDLNQPIEVLNREYITSIPDREIPVVAAVVETGKEAPPKKGLWDVLSEKIVAFAQDNPILKNIIKPMSPQWPPDKRGAGRGNFDPRNVGPGLEEDVGNSCFVTKSCKGKIFSKTQVGPSHTANSPSAFPAGNRLHELVGMTQGGGDWTDYTRIGFMKDKYELRRWIDSPGTTIPSECSYGDIIPVKPTNPNNGGCGWPDGAYKDGKCYSYSCTHVSQRNVDVYNNVPYLWSAWWQTAGDCFSECMTRGVKDADMCSNSCEAQWGIPTGSPPTTIQPTGFLNLFKPAGIWSSGLTDKAKDQSKKNYAWQPQECVAAGVTPEAGKYYDYGTCKEIEIASCCNKRKYIGGNPDENPNVTEVNPCEGGERDSCPPGTPGYDVDVCGEYGDVTCNTGASKGWDTGRFSAFHFSGDGKMFRPDRSNIAIGSDVTSSKDMATVGCSVDEAVVFDLDAGMQLASFAPIMGASKVSYDFTSHIPSMGIANDETSVKMTSNPTRKLLYYRLGGLCNANTWFSQKVLVPANYIGELKTNTGATVAPVPPPIATVAPSQIANPNPERPRPPNAAYWDDELRAFELEGRKVDWATGCPEGEFLNCDAQPCKCSGTYWMQSGVDPQERRGVGPTNLQ